MTGSICVLHVDDEPDFGALVADFLERKADDFTVLTETSAADGLERLAAESGIDCIVSDYDMSEKDGIEFLDAVRGTHPELPFVLFTGKGSEEVASEAISAGATDYLQKGGGAEQYDLLANRIRNAVEQRRSRQRAVNLDRLRTLAAEVNQRLVRAESTAEVQSRVCQAIVDADPYRCARIVRVDDGTDRGEPRIATEQQATDLDDVPVPLVTDRTESGPTARALRGRTVAVTQDIETDPAFEPWRRTATEHDIRSAAAVPLDHSDGRYGALVVYATQPNAFDADERALLEELASDIAHAIHAHEVRSELERFRTLLDRTNDAIFMIDPETGEFSNVNERTCALTGYSREELLDRRITDIDQGVDTVEQFHDLVDRIRSEGSILVEGVQEAKDGSTYPVEVRLDYTAVNGRPHVVAIARDISERKQRERELERYERIMENLPVGVFRTSSDGEIVSMNDQFATLYGGESTADLADAKAWEFYANDADRAELVRQLEPGDLIEDHLIEMVTLDGERKWIETTLRLTEEDGDRYLDGIVQDVTDRRERLHRLEQAETMFENAQDALFLIDVDERFTIERVNPAYSDATGLSAAAVEGRTPQEIVGEDSGEGIEQRYERCARERTTLEYEEELAIDGDASYWETRITPVVIDGAVEKIVGATRNITERKQREQELRRSERRFQAILDDPNILAGVLDTDGTLLKQNQTAIEYVDAATEDVEGELFWETPWWPEAMRPTIREHVERAADGEYVEYEADLTKPDGEPYSVEGAIRPVTDDSGAVVSLIVSSRDITERVVREKRLKAILENTTVPLFMKHRNGEYLMVNEGFRELFGLTDTDVCGQTDADLFQPEMAEEVQRNDRRVLESGDPLEAEERIFVDGTERTFLTSKTPVYDIGTESDPTEPVALLGVANDITEQKNRARHLERRHERVDEVASAVSHDLRTPLETARGRAQLAIDTGDTEQMEQVLDRLERTDELRRDLVEVLRTGDPVSERESVDIERVGRDAWRTIATTEEASLRIASGATVVADPEALRRLFENLLSNAVEHGDGDVSVRIGGTTNGFFVEDDGPGIPPDERDDVFEPGHSTERDGSGVGLASVEQIVAAHDWSITITDSAAGGARFEIATGDDLVSTGHDTDDEPL